jgi:hypothetical protein
MTSLHVGTLGRKTGIHITARSYYVVGLGMRSNVLFTLQTGSVNTRGIKIHQRSTFAGIPCWKEKRTLTAVQEQRAVILWIQNLLEPNSCRLVCEWYTSTERWNGQHCFYEFQNSGDVFMSARWRGTQAKRTARTPPRPTCIGDFHLLHLDFVNLFFLKSRITCAQNLNLYLKSVVRSKNRIPRRQWCIVQGVKNGSLWTILLFDTEVSTCR